MKMIQTQILLRKLTESLDKIETEILNYSLCKLVQNAQFILL